MTFMEGEEVVPSAELACTPEEVGEGELEDAWFPESEFVRFPGAWVRRVEPDSPIARFFAAVDPRLIAPRRVELDGADGDT